MATGHSIIKSRTMTLRRHRSSSHHWRFGVVMMAVISCATIVLHPTLLLIDAYSFVSSRHRSQLSQQNKYSQNTCISSHRQQPSSLASSIVMKKPPNRSQLQIPSSAGEESSSSELPANLKRYVVAKRPTLGHVVPKKARTRQYKPEQSSSQEQQQLVAVAAGGSNSAILRPQGITRDSERYNNPSSLRILGGSIRGRKLESPNVYLRPMMGKVKEAVYSTFTSFGLYEESTKVRHLDIFSGSGSVGLESLSRGASHCTFVDMSSDCCTTCERNVQRCGFDGWIEGGIGSGISDEGEPQARVVCTDAYRALRHPEIVGIPSNSKYDIVTLCPPYEEIVYADLLEAVANSVLVTEDTIILVEYPVELGCLPHVISREDGGVLVGVRNRRYGRTVIAMYIVNPTGAREAAQSKPEEFISI
ncbi:hypothetical protein ACHAXH_008039 [Discostella pseudostelligera]